MADAGAADGGTEALAGSACAGSACAGSACAGSACAEEAVAAALADAGVRVVLVTGDAGSGKSSVCRSAMSRLDGPRIVAMDLVSAAQSPVLPPPQSVVSTSPATSSKASRSKAAASGGAKSSSSSSSSSRLATSTRLDMFIAARNDDSVTVVFVDDVDASLAVTGSTGVAALSAVAQSVRRTPRPRSVLLLTSTAADPFAVQSKGMRELARMVDVRVALTLPTSADALAEAKAAGRRKGAKKKMSVRHNRLLARFDLDVMTLEAAAAWDGGNEALAWEASVLRSLLTAAAAGTC